MNNKDSFFDDQFEDDYYMMEYKCNDCGCYFDSDEIIPTCPECWSMDVSDNDDLFLDFFDEDFDDEWLEDEDDDTLDYMFFDELDNF